MSLTRGDFNYDLPANLIAHAPRPRRDTSRLLVFRRQDGTWSHHFFYQLPDILAQTGYSYIIVRNNSRVIPARLRGIKASGGQVEILLVRRLKQTPTTQTWECLTKPGLVPGQTVALGQSQIQAVCQKSSGYTRVLTFEVSPTAWELYLSRDGQTPIPPYIHTRLTEKQLRQKYQTVYAQIPGSVAAPTAGLHFTPALFKRLTAQGHDRLDLTLHVGLGTFLGVKTDKITDHQIHREYFQLTQTNARSLQAARGKGKKILAIGTTSTRVLETLAPKFDQAVKHDLTGQTKIFIYPPYRFRATDALLTNFHLPQSTLLMLVSAFVSAPNSSTQFDTWKTAALGRAYADAIKLGYRFFSFGDAMLIF